MQSVRHDLNSCRALTGACMETDRTLVNTTCSSITTLRLLRCKHSYRLPNTSAGRHADCRRITGQLCSFRLSLQIDFLNLKLATRRLSYIQRLTLSKHFINCNIYFIISPVGGRIAAHCPAINKHQIIHTMGVSTAWNTELLYPWKSSLKQ